MPPRSIWRGQLRISLVTIPVRLFTAVESASRIQLHRLHKNCGLRVRNQLKCPKHGELENSDVVKGFEHEKDRYVVIEDEELEQIKLETDKVVDVQQFAGADQLDQRFLDRPYYLAPDGPVAERSYTMIREAMEKAGVVAIAKVVLSSREQVMAICPSGNGFVAMTLRLADEVRASEPYFEQIKQDEKPDKNQMKLAQQLIENMEAPLDLEQYRDRYQEKLKALVNAKLEGHDAEVYEEEQEAAPMDITEALRQSLDQASGRKPAAKSTKSRRSTERRKKGA